MDNLGYTRGRKTKQKRQHNTIFFLNKYIVIAIAVGLYLKLRTEVVTCISSFIQCCINYGK